MDDKIVAVFLTARDIVLLGDGFKRHFPVPDTGGGFEYLLAKLDQVDPIDFRETQS